MHENFLIHVTRKSFLQSISHYVSNTFRWYYFGQVDVTKAPRLIEKFHRRYGVLDNKHQFEKKRRKQHARTRLVMYLPPSCGDSPEGSQTLDFILLATDGGGAVHELENLNRVGPKEPLRYGNLNCRKEAGMRGGGKPKKCWSWYFNQQFYKSIRESCLHAVKLRDLRRARNLTGQLMAYPPHQGIRKQRDAIFRSMRRTGVHAGHSIESLDFIPTSQFWVRKGKKETRPLGSIIS